MDKIYLLEACSISVKLEPGVIRVFSDAELWKFLNTQTSPRFTLLADTIKSDYHKEFGSVLKISDPSLIVEILVHVFCDNLGLKFNHYIKFNPLNKLISKLIHRAEIIDCGERGKDSNRWIWDSLAKFKSLLINMLPKELDYKKFK